MDWSPLIVSIKTACLSTVITFFLGLLAAWFVARSKSRFKGVIDSILMLPLILPPTVIGFFLLVFFGKNGPIGSFLYESFSVSVIFTWTATVIAATVVSFPLMYKTARGAFEQVDDNLIYSARTLGAKEWRIFWKVVVPVAWPGICAGAVLAFARGLGEFGATLMIAGNIVGKTQTIPLAIYFAVEAGDMNKAYLWVGLIFAISLIGMILMNYWTQRQQKNQYGRGR